MTFVICVDFLVQACRYLLNSYVIDLNYEFAGVAITTHDTVVRDTVMHFKHHTHDTHDT